MNRKLSIDEYDALEQVSKLPRSGKPSVCVARNTKRLVSIKMFSLRKDGGVELTESGKQTLFIKQCIDGLREIANQPGAAIPAAVATFLGKKGHIAVNQESGQTEITARGRECLEDIEANKASEK